MCLERLYDKYVKEGTLKSLTIKAFYDHEPRRPHFLGDSGENWLHSRTARPYDDQLWGHRCDDYQLKRKVIFTVELAQKMMAWANYGGLTGLGIVIKDINDGFGGEFWVGDKLCWADGTQVEVLELDEEGCLR